MPAAPEPPAEAPDRNRHVVYFFDRGFEACTLVSVHSVLARTPGPLRITLHPTETPGPTLDTDIGRMAARFPQAALSVVPVDITPFADLPAGPLPLTSRIRLLLPTLHSGRLLYIDGDTLARKDITPLLDTDLGDNCVAGAPVPRVALNLALAKGSDKRAEAARAKLAQQSEQLGGIDMTRYFNAGIMIFDLDRIAALGLDAAMTDIRNTENYFSRDQTYLNALFNAQAAGFDPQWNSGWGEPRTGKSYVPREVRERFRLAREDPGILHYKGPEKPWSAPTPPLRVSLLLNAARRRARARFWREFQAERVATEAVLGRALWG